MSDRTGFGDVLNKVPAIVGIAMTLFSGVVGVGTAFVVSRELLKDHVNYDSYEPRIRTTEIVLKYMGCRDALSSEGLATYGCEAVLSDAPDFRRELYQARADARRVILLDSIRNNR